MSTPVHDLIGVGIGPFNLGLAALSAPVPELDGLFLDEHEEFSWHPGMLIEGTTLQVPFLADLVTMADPTSPYSYLAYLKATGHGITRGLHLDRRPFLNSYDPRQDENHAILERILAAVGPVGAGISLEYYFSSVDNERYGCGTKLPHNVTGLVGVMAGHQSDLRTGLPLQMVEIHEPMRLLLIVDATPESLLAVAGRQPEVAELVVNEWVQLVSCDPHTGAMTIFEDGAFVPYVPARDPVPEVKYSRDWHMQGRQHLPPAIVRGALVAAAAPVVAHA